MMGKLRNSVRNLLKRKNLTERTRSLGRKVGIEQLEKREIFAVGVGLTQPGDSNLRLNLLITSDSASDNVTVEWSQVGNNTQTFDDMLTVKNNGKLVG